MGNYFDKPPYIPEENSKSTFDPQFGFEAPRKKREILITEQEMEASRIPRKQRDYCAHLLPPFYQCVHDAIPVFMRCRHELHHYHECQRQDYILRMKEFEREKRLRLRQMKLDGIPTA